MRPQIEISHFIRKLKNAYLFERAFNYTLFTLSSLFVIIFAIKLLSVMFYIKSPYLVSIPFASTAFLLFVLHFFTSIPDLESFILSIDKKLNSGELLITMYEMQGSETKNPYYELMTRKTLSLINGIDSSIYSVSHKNAIIVFCTSFILFILSNFLPSQNNSFQNPSNQNSLLTILNEIKNALPHESQVYKQVSNLTNVFSDEKGTTQISFVKELESISKNLQEGIENLELADDLKNVLKKYGFNENFSEKEIDNFIKQNAEKLMNSAELRAILNESIASSSSSTTKDSLSQILKAISDNNYEEFFRLISQTLKESKSSSKITPEKKILLKMNISELNNFIFNMKNKTFERIGNEYSSSSLRIENIDINEKNYDNITSDYKHLEKTDLMKEQPIIQKLNLPDDYKKVLKKVYSPEE